MHIYATCIHVHTIPFFFKPGLFFKSIVFLLLLSVATNTSLLNPLEEKKHCQNNKYGYGHPIRMVGEDGIGK